MLYMSVTRDKDGKSGMQNLPVTEILYLEFDMADKWVHVHTTDEFFFIPGTLNYWMESLKTSGYQFERVDRSYVVNIPKIVRMDTKFYMAYFDQTNTKKVTMSQKLFKEIFHIVRASHQVAIV